MATKLIEVAPGSLQPNPWNTNHLTPQAEEKLDASLQRLGMFKPVVCRELSDGSLQILGGEHRAKSAVRLERPTVPVINLGRVDDKRAKEISLVDNGRYGNDDTLQLAALLQELGDVDELATFMPYTDAEIASIFTASSIALDDLDLPDDPTDSPLTPTERPAQTHAVMRFKVPIDDVEAVEKVIDGIMRAQKFTDEDSLTNAGHGLVWLTQDWGKK